MTSSPQYRLGRKSALMGSAGAGDLQHWGTSSGKGDCERLYVRNDEVSLFIGLTTSGGVSWYQEPAFLVYAVTSVLRSFLSTHLC